MKSFNLVTLVVATLFVDMVIVPVPVANAFRGEDDGPAELSLSDFRRQLRMGKTKRKTKKRMRKTKKKRKMSNGSDDEDPPLPPSPTPAPIAPVVLENKWENEAECIVWASQGQCVRESESYMPWMPANCAYSCEQAGNNFPTLSPASQDRRDCDRWAKRGECVIEESLKFMWRNCVSECEIETGTTRGPVDPPTDDPANSNGVDDGGLTPQ